MEKQGFEKSYRRFNVDSHIPDWNETFYSKFDPEDYVDTISLAAVDTAWVWANSHVGDCFYPTRTGHMHERLDGRDVFAEIIELYHQRRIQAVVYYSLISNKWAWQNHPDWRAIRASGKSYGDNSRYSNCCPNSPYRDFVFRQLEEICGNYDFEGIWFDMTSWPGVCYCQYCAQRFSDETGRELPKIIDWYHPTWVAFQEKREEWILGFASEITHQIKRLRPHVAVWHQNSPFMDDWRDGVSFDLADCADYCSADFYLDTLPEISFVCKLLNAISKNKPAEFLTTCHLDLTDHTTIKPRELLQVEAFTTLASFCPKIRFL